MNTGHCSAVAKGALLPRLSRFFSASSRRTANGGVRDAGVTVWGSPPCNSR